VSTTELSEITEGDRVFLIDEWNDCSQLLLVTRTTQCRIHTADPSNQSSPTQIWVRKNGYPIGAIRGTRKYTRICKYVPELHDPILEKERSKADRLRLIHTINITWLDCKHNYDLSALRRIYEALQKGLRQGSMLGDDA